MSEKMFCFQCQETAGCSGCTTRGVCGKEPKTAALQDLLLFVTKGTAWLALEAEKNGRAVDDNLCRLIRDNLFITITNANFDDQAITKAIKKTLNANAELMNQLSPAHAPEAAYWQGSEGDFLPKAVTVSPLATKNEDLRSLRELLTYGLKGLAAYAHHADALNAQDRTVDQALWVGLAATLDDELGADELIALILQTGQAGVTGMALLDRANTSAYGQPSFTEVSLETGTRPGILVSGHDLADLEELLKQTEGTGIDIYTHSEMLPAHSYPEFKKYPHLKGNYGNAWWQQREEFESFGGPILMTTNCIVPPKESYKERLYTTGAAGYPGCRHIEGTRAAEKDFSPLIKQALTCQAPTPLEKGTVLGGFAHEQVLALADQIKEAVLSGAVKKFVVMAGCDGRSKARNYYRDFAQALPKDTVILTAGCAKYRYNKLNLGTIGGIPRVLDAGQCNDCYSLALVALRLKELFGLEDINDLPIVYNIAWYEQKAVIVLLALLSLGVKGIRLGPTLPAFLSPNVAKTLIQTFDLKTISDVESDLIEVKGESLSA